MKESIGFPGDFLWGAATSAHQIEGSPLADGAGPSIWHRFAHTPGRTANGDTGDVACDHYHRYEADVRLMRQLGLDAYRFSIAWGRILPEGTGRVNPAGVGFYDRLVDALLEAGIRPFPTLYHWDLPAALDDRGGWLNADVAEWFAEYARRMFSALGDRVTMWSTLNEPWVVMDGGYLNGGMAPGHSNLFEAPIATHNLLRAHGAAVRAARAEGDFEVGLVVNLEPKYPASDSVEDREAARLAEAYMNRQYLQPVMRGSYPQELREIFGEAWVEPSAADMELIREPLDFLGINYYTRSVVAHDPTAPSTKGRRVRQAQHLHTEMEWEVFAPALTETLLWVTREYGPIPLYLTENGAAFRDPPSPIDGAVDDPLRVDYYRRHLAATLEAIRRGADVRGYFAWSLLDNYEWSHGYSKRFGIVHVDFATQERTIKSSGKYYREVIAANREG